MEALFSLWSPLAVLIAGASGVAFAVVVSELVHPQGWRAFPFLVFVMGLLWYVPQAVSLWAEGRTPYVTFGRMLLFLTAFILPMALTLRVRSRDG